MRLSRANELKMIELAEKHGLTLKQVKDVIYSPYKFIREKTKELELEEGLSKEEFKKIKTNFNIPALCKLYASYYIYKKINEKKNGRE